MNKIKIVLLYNVCYFRCKLSYYCHLVFVYLFVNFFENLVHYNIGKSSDKEIKFKLPSKKDWIKIVVVMSIFALIQGLLTYYFNKYLKFKK